MILEILLGKTYEEAKQIIYENELSIRVVKEDGVSYIVTCDVDIERVNLELKNNIVIISLEIV